MCTNSRAIGGRRPRIGHTRAVTGDERRVRPGAVIGSLRRHPGVALAAFALPVALVVGALLVLPREFEATGAVRLDPVAVPALDPSWPLDADPHGTGVA